jgi:hypothetical protein
MLLHGFRSIFLENVVDYPIPWYMYKNAKEKFWDQKIPNNGKAYGAGFTIAGTLSEKLIIDRGNIDEKILDHFFDLIIYGSARRNLTKLDIVLSSYKKNEIIFVDGQDQTDIRWNLINSGIYFKRELIYEDERIHPIEFCFPEEKIFVGQSLEKTKLISSIIPGRLETYTFNIEEDYYKEYQNSYFAYTSKKGGWDCLRHYEIIANYCLPIFNNIEECPPRTMYFFPKDFCSRINKEFNSPERSYYISEKYKSEIIELVTYFRTKLTTKKMAEYILDISDFENEEKNGV